jgi:hypothetical protein
MQWSNSLLDLLILDIILVYVDDLFVFSSSKEWMTALGVTIMTFGVLS